MGAAAPWIVFGRVIRFGLRPFMAGVFDGMTGSRILGLALLAVAILGSTGLDLTMEHWLNAILPAWTHKLALTF
jgi:hypothetical protein